MKTVTVHNLKVVSAGGFCAVTFQRYNNDPPATLNCRPCDVLSQHPPRVKLTIPPEARISDMSKFNGQEILLVCEPPFLLPSDGEE